MLKKVIRATGIWFIALGTAGNAVAECAVCSPNFICIAKQAVEVCPQGSICKTHDDDCGDWTSVFLKYPKIKPPPLKVAAETTKSTTPIEICQPGDRGPSIPLETPDKLLSHSDGNWLLAMALLQLSKISSDGIYDGGVFAFPLAETADQRKAVLTGAELQIPEFKRDEFLSGFNGYAKYSTTSRFGSLSLATLPSIEVELQVFRLDREKLVPTHGITAIVRYERIGTSPKWALKSTQLHYGMPRFQRGDFSGTRDHPELFSETQVGAVKISGG
ncbi:MAG: hypothetical protein V4582_12970 [Pseudomonadota bacterium]